MVLLVMFCLIGGNDHNHGGNASFLRKPPVVVKSSGLSSGGGHSHGGGGGSVQQRISQALDMISLNSQPSTEAKLQSSALQPPTVPLYENTSMEFTARQPAGKPIQPIR